jgi:asparagine synthase (glutamine-hydrolysing)
MFALAFWEEKSRCCLLARDRAGEKPLFFANNREGSLFFASEMRAIVAGLGFCPTVDQMGLHRYLTLGYIPSPGTMLEGIQQLEPGSFMLWHENREPVTRKYWGIFDLPSVDSIPKPTAVLDALQNSVKWRLKADVPVGLLVSGGVDSSAIATLACRESNSASSCFSLGFEEAGYDELPWAEQVVSGLGLRHRRKRLGHQEIPQLAARALAAMDGPIGDPSWIPTFALAELTSAEVKVALGGDGADELFGGYQAFSFERLATVLEAQRWIPAQRLGTLLAYCSPSKGYRTPRYAIHQFLKGLGMPRRHRHFVWLGAWTPEESARLLGIEEGGHRDFWSFLRKEAADRRSGNSLLANYFRYYLGESLLVKSDRASMACGLEIRSPFLDSRMIQLAMQIPYSQKVRGGKAKVFLKETLSVVLDESILRRPKQGFAPPLSDWVRGPLKNDLGESLRQVESKWSLFSATEPQRLMNEHLSNYRDHRRKLWVLYALDKGLGNLQEAAG